MMPPVDQCGDDDASNECHCYLLFDDKIDITSRQFSMVSNSLNVRRRLRFVNVVIGSD